MKIRDIEIEDFRKLRHARISGLGDGANVIAGENEAGKSTVLAALQAALFQRHNVGGKVLASMQPYGCSVRPTVKVAFELEGGFYRLRKTFGGTGSAELLCPDGRRYSNHDADRRLEELLQFRAAARGATDFASLGMWPLFWIEQGTTFQGLNINPEVRSTVQSSLTKEVGDVLVGEAGERTRCSVERLYAGYFTKTGLESGTLLAARKAVTVLEGRLTDARQELAAFSEDVLRLEALLGRRASLKQPELRTALEAELNKAQDAVSALSDLDRQIADATYQMQGAGASRANAQLVFDQRVELISKLSQLEHRVSILGDSSHRLSEQLASAARETKCAEEGCQKADSAVEDARQKVQTAEYVLQYATATAQTACLQKRVEKAKGLIDQLGAAELALAQYGVTEQKVKELNSIERALIQCRAIVESAATKVEFSFDDPDCVRVAGDPLGDRTSILAADELTIELPEGRIRITPGGSELSEERRKLNRLEERLAATLASIGATRIDDAIDMLDRRRAIEAEQRKLLAIIHELTPSGIGALESEWQRSSVRADALRDKINGASVPLINEAESLLAEAKVLASRAEASASQARAILDTSRSRETETRITFTGEMADLGAASREVKAVAEHLLTERTKLSDEATLQALSTAKSEEEMARALVASLKEKRNDLDPEAIRVCAKNAEAALQRLSDQIIAADREISGLQGRLDGLGEKGLGETCATIEADLTIARLRLRVVEEDAYAIRVLHKTLESAEREANEVFLEPVVRRVQPYLGRVLPGSRIELGTDLAVEGLRRDGTVEPFFALSIGVREQLSVVTRIAFADMLSEQGVEAPIILDDALVYADDLRFRNTLTSLAIAAARHQIIILTCHCDRYIRLGCATKEIEYMNSDALV